MPPIFNLEGNEESGEVMKKAGMTLEAKLVDEFFRNGQFYNVKRYYRLNESS